MALNTVFVFEVILSNFVLSFFSGDHLVPGHPHFWEEMGQLFLGYDFRTSVPETKEDSMAVRRLYFDEAGWPTIWMPLTVEISSKGRTREKVANDSDRLLLV